MQIEELAKAIADPSFDAVELTRLALVVARSRTREFEVASNTDATIVIADEALRSFVHTLSGGIAPRATIDLTPAIREDLRAHLRTAIEKVPAAELLAGLEGLVAHKLALALEEVFGPRFFDHLRAAGRRDLGPHDLLVFATPFRDPNDSFREAYESNLAPNPTSLGAIGPDALSRYARLTPELPHAAKLRWDPSWMVLDDIEPDSTAVTVFPCPFDELTRDDDEERKTFFHVRPTNSRERTDAALELVAQADAGGAHILLLPELCLDAEGLERLATWVEEEADSIKIAVCGSAHRERDGCRENVAIVAAPREMQDYCRVEQRKLTPFVLKRSSDGMHLEEDIRRVGHAIVLLSGRRSSALVLICRDFIDRDLSRLAQDLRPTFVFVPACSETTGPFHSVAYDLVSRFQAHVIVANQRPGEGDPDAALLARPRREGRDVVVADRNHDPGRRSIVLASGGWS